MKNPILVVRGTVHVKLYTAYAKFMFFNLFWGMI